MRLKSFFPIILAFIFLASLVVGQAQAGDVLQKQIRVPATSMFPDQSNTPTKGDTAIGNQGYVFSNTATDSLHAYVPLPLDMCDNSHVEPYVVFAQNATGPAPGSATQVKIRLSHVILNDSGNSTVTDDARYFEITNETAQKGEPLAYKFNQIGTTNFDPGDVLHFELSRIGGDGSDNATENTIPLAIELHYQQCVGEAVER